MNKALAGALRTINAACAYIIVLAGGIIGYNLSVVSGSSGDADHWLGGLFGASAGFLVAVMVCGIVALLIQIERHLADISGHMPANGTLPSRHA